MFDSVFFLSSIILLLFFGQILYSERNQTLLLFIIREGAPSWQFWMYLTTHHWFCLTLHNHCSYMGNNDFLVQHIWRNSHFCGLHIFCWWRPSLSELSYILSFQQPHFCYVCGGVGLLSDRSGKILWIHPSSSCATLFVARQTWYIFIGEGTEE